MMKVFATRVWGFDPTTWPLITFNTEGNRDRLLKESEVGDRIVFVGTQGEPTTEAERGRLLGMAEIGRVPVDSLDILDPAVLDSDSYDEHGNFKWPKALIMTRAWAFPTKPRLLAVIAAQLPYNATTQGVLLSQSDTDSVLALAVSEIQIPETDTLRRLRTLQAALGATKPTHGPPPSDWIRQTGRQLGRNGITYALRFGKTDIWKIGHTTDLTERVKSVNWHIPTEVNIDSWRVAYQQVWPNEAAAYAMEQRVLSALAARRTVAERVKCSEKEIFAAWQKGIGLS